MAERHRDAGESGNRGAKLKFVVVLPIVERELRVASRKKESHRVRVIPVFVTLFAAAIYLYTSRNSGAPSFQVGANLFNILSWVAFLYALLVGVQTTSDIISREKREDTLGLLFLTDLTGRDVVLGKLVASSINAFYALMAIFPVLAVSLLLGGVTLEQLAKVVLVLINTMFFSLSIGVLVSTLSRVDRKAFGGTIMTLLVVTFLPFALLAYLFHLLEQYNIGIDSSVSILVGSVLLPSPALAFLSATGFGPMSAFNYPLVYWISLVVVHMLAWLALFRAMALVPHSWRDKPMGAKAMSFRQWWERLAFGIDPQRRERRQKLLSANPFLWLSSRDRLKPFYAWLFVIAMIVNWTRSYYKFPELMLDNYPLVPTILMIHGFLKIWVMGETSYRLVSDQRTGALELILSSPVSAAEMIQGQMIALRKQFLYPVTFFMAAQWIPFLTRYSAWEIAMTQAVLVLDMVTLVYVAMWLSLTASGLNQVILRCVGLVMVLPLAATGAILFLWKLSRRNTGEMPLDLGSAISVYFAVSLVANLILIFGWARPNLLANMRSSILRRFETSRSAIPAN